MTTGVPTPGDGLDFVAECRVPAFIGDSSLVCRVREQLGRLKHLSVPVAIVGPTGTGKEIVARLLHVLSNRAATGKFVPVNCAALHAGTAESQIFGHEAGAFTGASGAHKGFLEQARGGTLFLDELAEMPPPIQAMLLRVLEEGEFVRMGGERPVPADFRLVVSSQQPLRALAEAGRLREDIFHRLNRASVTLPPLSDRREDIPLLVNHFNRMFAIQYGCRPLAFEADLLKALCEWDWPGNVRELRNEVERAFIEGFDGLLRDLKWRGPPPHGGGILRRGRPTRDAGEYQRRAEDALKRTDGSYQAAADLLGISKSTFYRWLKVNKWERARASTGKTPIPINSRPN